MSKFRDRKDLPARYTSQKRTEGTLNAPGGAGKKKSRGAKKTGGILRGSKLGAAKEGKRSPAEVKE